MHLVTAVAEMTVAALIVAVVVAETMVTALIVAVVQW